VLSLSLKKNSENIGFNLIATKSLLEQLFVLIAIKYRNLLK